MTVSSPDILENLRLELRRGSLILAVLAQLRSEKYGYTLRKSLADKGIAIDEGTLYPLLRRLETQGLLVSQWREEEKRNKRFYRLSSYGELTLTQLLLDWEALASSLDGILRGEGEATVHETQDPATSPDADLTEESAAQSIKERR